jgi:hypothetical protein
MPKSKTNLHDKITQWLQVYCGADGGKHFQFTSKEYELLLLLLLSNRLIIKYF